MKIDFQVSGSVLIRVGMQKPCDNDCQTTINHVCFRWASPQNKMSDAKAFCRLCEMIFGSQLSILASSGTNSKNKMTDDIFCRSYDPHTNNEMFFHHFFGVEN